MKSKFVTMVFLLFVVSLCPVAHASGQAFDSKDVQFSVRPRVQIKNRTKQFHIDVEFTNKSSEAVYIANWGNRPFFYDQNEGRIEVSFLPFGNPAALKGKGWFTAGPSAFYARFARLRPGSSRIVSIAIPPVDSDSWKLHSGEWTVIVRHLWLKRLSDVESLFGLELAKRLKSEANFVESTCSIVIE